MKILVGSIILSVIFLLTSCNYVFSQQNAFAYEMGPSSESIAASVVLYSFVGEKPSTPPKRNLDYIMVGKKIPPTQPKKTPVIKLPQYEVEDFIQENSNAACVNGTCPQTRTYSRNNNLRTKYFRIFR